MGEPGGWAATMPGILAVLTGAGLWGLIAVEGLLGQLRPAEGSKSMLSWAPLLTVAAAIGAFYLGGRARRAEPPKRLAVAGRVGGGVRDGGLHYRHSALTRCSRCPDSHSNMRGSLARTQAVAD
jgi:hypothetical protein